MDVGGGWGWGRGQGGGGGGDVLDMHGTYNSTYFSFSEAADRLVGLVVKACASRAEDPGFESRLRRDIFVVESYQ